uniref:Uncharacterized protein n=1 Tax=Ditylenchus dipsaci TaxID=166011 RepID=A0A915DKU3_9BILA
MRFTASESLGEKSSRQPLPTASDTLLSKLMTSLQLKKMTTLWMNCCWHWRDFKTLATSKRERWKTTCTLMTKWSQRRTNSGGYCGGIAANNSQLADSETMDVDVEDVDPVEPPSPASKLSKPWKLFAATQKRISQIVHSQMQ